MSAAEHVALPSAFGEAFPVLADQEVIEEPRRAALGEHVPRHRERDRQGRTRQPWQTPPYVDDSAFPYGPQPDRCKGQHDAHGSFCEEADRKTHEERVTPGSR